MLNEYRNDPATGIRWIDYKYYVQERFPDAWPRAVNRKAYTSYGVRGSRWVVTYDYYILAEFKAPEFRTDGMRLGLTRKDVWRAWKTAYQYLKRVEDEESKNQLSSSSV